MEGSRSTISHLWNIQIYCWICITAWRLETFVFSRRQHNFYSQIKAQERSAHHYCITPFVCWILQKKWSSCCSILPSTKLNTFHKHTLNSWKVDKLLMLLLVISATQATEWRNHYSRSVYLLVFFMFQMHLTQWDGTIWPKYLKEILKVTISQLYDRELSEGSKVLYNTMTGLIIQNAAEATHVEHWARSMEFFMTRF